MVIGPRFRFHWRSRQAGTPRLQNWWHGMAPRRHGRCTLGVFAIGRYCLRPALRGRIIESAGEDPYLGSAMARAWVKGYQQDDLSKSDSVAVSVKHFAAYGAAIAGRDYNAVEMGEPTLRKFIWKPYQAAVVAQQQ